MVGYKRCGKKMEMHLIGIEKVFICPKCKVGYSQNGKKIQEAIIEIKKKIFDDIGIPSEEIAKEMIEYIKSMKRKTNVGMDKHLCDHILWLIKDCVKARKKHLGGTK